MFAETSSKLSGSRSHRDGRRRIALVTHGLGAGGVSTVAIWLRQSLESTGRYTVDIHDLATSRQDSASRRIAAPATWRRASLRSASDDSPAHQHWGANAVEIEAMRYRPRRELSRALRGYDLVQVVSGSPAWAAAVLGCGPPVVLQVATLAAWERRSQLPADRTLLRGWRRCMTDLTSRIETTALRGADMVLVENDAMLSHVRATGQSLVAKMAPGVDTTAFAPPGSPWNKTAYVLSVGRLGDPRKGLDLLIRAYHLLVREDERTPRLVVAGRGPLTDSVTRLIAHLGLRERVTIRCDVTAAELVGIYQGASVFVQTSHEEGLGMAVLEAMACGLPVVSTATNGSIEVVVDDRTGWLVDVHAADVPREIATRVRRALTGIGADAGERGRARCVAEFSTEVSLGRFTRAYDFALGRSAR